MTAATLAVRPDRAAARPNAHRVTFPRVVASEWVKLTSLRSTWWTLGLTVVLMAGISALVAWGTASGMEGEGPGTMSLPGVLGSGTGMAELTIAVLGVLIITGEYATGQIRSTFAATPARLPVLAAKALVLAITAAVTTVVGMGAAWLASLAWHDSINATLDLGRAEDLRMLVGVPLFMAGIGLLAMAVGALVRRTPGALAAIFGLLLVVETVFALVPLRFFEVVRPFLPASAGGRLLSSDADVAALNAIPDVAHLTPWQGFGVLGVWIVVLFAVAAVLLRRRDA